MLKTVWILLLAMALVPLDSDRAFAQLFLSKIKEDAGAWTRSQAATVQVAQAVPETGDQAVEESASFAEFEDRFAKGRYEFGLTLGYGFTFNLPPTGLPPRERTHIKLAYVFPNFKYNLTGLMGNSGHWGALYWVIEAGVAFPLQDPERNNLPVDDAPTFVVGFVPAQIEYKFLSPGRRWAPFVFAGVGVSWGDWFQESKEIATAFEFILQGGGGIEYFFANGTALNINYRLWHLSNANMKSPNIGINAHIFSLGFSF